MSWDEVRRRFVDFEGIEVGICEVARDVGGWRRS